MSTSDVLVLTLPNGYPVTIWTEGQYAEIKVPSSTEGQQHTVMLDATNNRMACTCKGFTFRQKCRHLKLVEDAIPTDEFNIKGLTLEMKVF